MKEALKVTQIRFPASLYAEARVQAGREQVSFNALVVKALAFYLETMKGEKHGEADTES